MSKSSPVAGSSELRKRPNRAPQPKAKVNAEEAPKGRGRPRNAKRHAAILEATRELILDVGYSRVTFDAVAKRSGASRTTLYEWWGHRAPLVEEAIFADYGDWPVPDSGDFETDLAQLVEEVVSEMSRPHVARAFPALSAESQADPSLKAGLRARYGDPMTRRWRQVFENAVAREQLAPTVDAEAALQLTIGAVLMMTQSKILPRKKLTPYLIGVLMNGLGSQSQ